MVYGVSESCARHAKGLDNQFQGPIRDTVPAGHYVLDIRYPPDCYVKEMTYNGLKLADGVLRVGPGESGTVRVLMAKGASELTIGVVDAEGKPVADAMVIVVPDSVTSRGCPQSRPNAREDRPEW